MSQIELNGKPIILSRICARDCRCTKKRIKKRRK